MNPLCKTAFLWFPATDQVKILPLFCELLTGVFCCPPPGGSKPVFPHTFSPLESGLFVNNKWWTDAGLAPGAHEYITKIHRKI